METQSKGTGRVVTALIVGLIIGFAAGVFWQDRRDSAVGGEEVAEAQTENTEEKSTASGNTDAAAVAGAPLLNGKIVQAMDQTAGTSVVVAQVVSDETVWVAVREE